MYFYFFFLYFLRCFLFYQYLTLFKKNFSALLNLYYYLILYLLYLFYLNLLYRKFYFIEVVDFI